MDYLAYDPVHRRVWVPAGNTGSVDVIDVDTDRVTRVEGFPTAAIERNGTRRIVGPSSATIGDGVVYVGNRGDGSVCTIDAVSLQRGACIRLESSPDGLAYVAATKEVWATLPRDRAIAIVKTGTTGMLSQSATLRLDGQPEGFAVDDSRRRFYTNLEDADRTLTIDVDRRQVIRTKSSGCGTAGPRGLALDLALDVLFVACTDRVVAFNAEADGPPLSAIVVGGGLDDIDYVEGRHELYAAAARSATLTNARLGADRMLTSVAVRATAAGARNAVATGDGTAYVTDSAAGAILVLPAPHVP
jgi:YVTN family beta-propeller protein